MNRTQRRRLLRSLRGRSSSDDGREGFSEKKSSVVRMVLDHLNEETKNWNKLSLSKFCFKLKVDVPRESWGCLTARERQTKFLLHLIRMEPPSVQLTYEWSKIINRIARLNGSRIREPRRYLGTLASAWQKASGYYPVADSELSSESVHSGSVSTASTDSLESAGF